MHPTIDVALRIYVIYSLAETDQDVSAVAFKLLEQSVVFDATYDGTMRGAAIAWSGNLVADLVSWLADLEVNDPPKPALFTAFQAFAADPKKYTGDQHLAAAKELASSDPALAYTQIANAAAFYVHATDKTPKAAIVAAHELAEANQWADLTTVLGWARTELKL